jgi:ribonucleoside-diphosphate reductase alpha chain
MNNTVMSSEMYVEKRDGRKEPVAFEKVSERLRKVAEGLNIYVTALAKKVIDQIADGIKTSELDELAASLAIENVTLNPDFGVLASRIIISNHQKNTPYSFVEAMTVLYNNVDKRGIKSPVISKELLDLASANAELIESRIKYDRDFVLDYFGFKTLERAYLLRDTKRRIIERPQHLWMRVSLGLWLTDIDRAFETYDMMSQKYFTHATPTLFNSGCPRPQLSSCFLLTMNDDSIKGIYKTLMDCALISQYAGGIGLSIHNIRAKGSLIKGTNGTSNGIVPMLRNFNSTARYVDQGGGKRNGSFAIYLEPWHADIQDFLKQKLNNGNEEERSRDLFYALWIPDLFMERVRDGGNWTLFCPSEAPGLADVVGDEFKALYEKYEAQGLGRATMPAQKLWFEALDSQIETGTPYLVYKDAANKKSNQQNVGVIKSSNLCSEIIEYSSPDETAVCNLASMGLASFVKDGAFDFTGFRTAVKVVVRNLNRVIDINYYPTVETRTSNIRHRPIGLGVQGLADVFALLRIPWEINDGVKVVANPDVVSLNKRIFAHMYYAAVETSCDLALEEGVYSTFHGSPASKGQLQPDLWNITALEELDWASLRMRVMKDGLRNSLLIAPMPTASTSQILGFNECFEPFTTNIYTRRTLAGEFIQVNKHLVSELNKLKLWSPELKDKIIARNGSVQGLDEVPVDIQALYKTVWELKQKTLIDLAADRGAYICQSQSLNLFVADPDYSKLTSMHFYAWNKGLKTGIYYLRTKAPVAAQQFTVDPSLKVKKGVEEKSATAAASASASEPAECLMCSS